MSDTPKPQNYEYSKKIKYKDMEFEIVFKIDSNSDLEILCLCENGLTFSTKKLNIKESNLDFELFSDLIKFDENWSLEGDIDKENFSIKNFKENINTFFGLKSSGNIHTVLKLVPFINPRKVISFPFFIIFPGACPEP